MSRRYFQTGSVLGALSGENLVGSAVVPRVQAVSRQNDAVAGERLPDWCDRHPSHSSTFAGIHHCSCDRS
ncbi:hypothetical protein [Laspinema olomoucense]|uniref:hypothetical protein n=1 Tax=Laspinema olomoucense TaxID=3231600 RepID=UPI0021BA3EB6|nr:hypothetical protein [Laspinema sp. D3d]MCT7973440.1 hypothetical protein [Laspinema sp. D3d]